ncbi:hypothetical protein AVEN_267703-1 [Araneus ventricosus]|uniref:Uncharacterized protein n=1 Tax=Araneus ventricosus TaxID=182803 RepID=A0A4Y2CXI5_ARAVE|nr:hypothetical protein AVEN_267703-1 [Araneus ventricosus]
MMMLCRDLAVADLGRYSKKVPKFGTKYAKGWYVYTTHSDPACQIGLRPETIRRGREPTAAGPETPRNHRPATAKLV